MAGGTNEKVPDIHGSKESPLDNTHKVFEERSKGVRHGAKVERRPPFLPKVRKSSTTSTLDSSKGEEIERRPPPIPEVRRLGYTPLLLEVGRSDMESILVPS
ncbi:hypothetical protein BHE74_00006755 [Ensete ventricosum]|nr:hypothetical protein BHE74_00006755 [Ensete ventricosum]RZR77441.1 hypothetical protein BHM03_00002510 [Ensete ventricosum]